MDDQSSDVRSPRWSKWRVMRRAELWQWIVLSLGLEPSLILCDLRPFDLGIASGPEFTGIPPELGREFVERLDVALSWLSNESSLRPASEWDILAEHKFLVPIDRKVFVDWTRELEWSIPRELSESFGKPAVVPDTGRIQGWAEIIEALTPILGVAPSERDARRRLDDAGVEVHREGGGVWIARDELSKLKAK